MYRKKITIIFLLINSCVFAHQDFYRIKKYGKITTRIKTGFEYEEIKKIELIGQLAQNLAKNLNYNKNILLDFNHFYTGNCVPDYFLSYDNGSIENTRYNSKTKPVFKKNKLIIRQVSNDFDIIKTLKLLEFSILNEEIISRNQRKIQYNKNYCNWIINSLSKKEIKIDTPHSELIKKLINQKTYRIEGEVPDSIRYYWKNNKYYIIEGNSFLKEENIILEVDKIFDFKKIYNTIFLFDSNDSFRAIYYDFPNDVKVSKKWKLINYHDDLYINRTYRPKKINHIIEDKFYFYHTRKMHVYSNKKDILIRDLDSLLNVN